MIQHHEAGSGAVVDLTGVHHAYEEAGRSHEILRGVDLQVERGERVALVGRSGSGKSTMLALAGGIERASGGSVRVCGVELASLGEAERTIFRRRRIGLVFQSLHLVPLLSVLENVTLPLDLDGRGGRDARERALEMLARVGLVDRAYAAPERLSGGEQQRVAIARALVHAPELVLADEPTGNLDEHTADSVLDLFVELCRERGHTLLMATHSLACAARCNRVLRLLDGHLAEVRVDGALPGAIV